LNRPEFKRPRGPVDDSAAHWGAEFFALSRDIFWVTDSQARIHSVNPVCRSITGYAAEELVGQSLFAFIDERDGHAVERTFERLESGARDVVLECRCLRKDGKTCWLSCSCTRAKAPSRLILIVGREITDRRGLEAEFVEMTNRYEAAASASGSIAYECNTETGSVVWGGNFHSILGYNSDEMAGSFAAWVDLVHPRDREAMSRGRRSIQVEKELPRLRYRVKRKAGDYIHVRDDARFYRDAGGRPTKMIGCIQDVTEQVRSRRELEHIKGRLELILQSIGDGICGLDAEGRVTFLNPAAEKMLGWSTEELIGKPFHATCHHSRKNGKPYHVEECAIIATSESEHSHLVVEDVFWRRDESSFPVECNATRIRDEDDVVGMVITFRDITERHRRLSAEQELRTARKVQQLLYPAGPPQIEGFDIAGAVFPAAMACGDYFDFLPFRDGKLSIAVGDVSGHGLGPALHMVQARAFLRSAIDSHECEVGVLQRLNDLLMQNRSDDFFLTLFLASLDPASRILNYAGAGHEARLLRRDDSIHELPSTGIVLGVLDELVIENAPPTQLEPGDVLLIATDGLMETYSPSRETFGWKRVLDVVRESRHLPAEMIVQELRTTTRQFGKKHPQLDDVTIVVVRVT
jgi:PAS domain S-box-containing protein